MRMSKISEVTRKFFPIAADSGLAIVVIVLLTQSAVAASVWLYLATS